MSTRQHTGDTAPAQGEYLEGDTAPESMPEAPEGAASFLDLLVTHAETASASPLARRIEGVVVGRVLRVDADGVVRVMFSGAPEPGFVARTTATLTKDDEQREVALLFENGDPRRPIVVGRMVSPLATGQSEATADGRRIEISAEEEIVLRCGESSLTLTRAGKIVLRGAYVLSQASGVNRIQGGSVEIN